MNSEEQTRIPTPPCPKGETLILEKSLGVRAQAISIQCLVLIPEILDKCLELCSNKIIVRWCMTVQERVTKTKKTRREMRNSSRKDWIKENSRELKKVRKINRTRVANVNQSLSMC